MTPVSTRVTAIFGIVTARQRVDVGPEAAPSTMSTVGAPASFSG